MLMMATTSNDQAGRCVSRKQAAEALGYTFNPGNWNSGHVSLDDCVVLFVTGDGDYADECKQGPRPNGEFRWSSQNSTTPTGKKGRELIDGTKPVYVFWRKTKRMFNIVRRFEFLGVYTYARHQGSAPMHVTFMPSNQSSPTVDPCAHRDTGRGVCVDCGAILESGDA